MEWFEVLALSISAISCTGICALAWYKAHYDGVVQAAIIQQQGIDRRAAAGMGNQNSTSPYSKQEWWVPLATELLKNEGIQKMIMNKVAPTLTGETKG